MDGGSGRLVTKFGGTVKEKLCNGTILFRSIHLTKRVFNKSFEILEVRVNC